MDTILPSIIAIAVILFFLARKSTKKTSVAPQPAESIANASQVIESDDFSDEVSVESDESFDGVDYGYDVVGESFQRDHLLALIRSHKAFASGEILTMAILEPEPTNDFDPTAVKVVVEGVQVGYVAKFDSAAVSKMIAKSGKKTMEVPARIGFDADSPAPLIGVRIALVVD